MVDHPTPLPASLLTSVPATSPYEGALLDLVDALFATICEQWPAAAATLARHICARAHVANAAGETAALRVAVLTVALDRMAQRLGAGMVAAPPPLPSGPVVDLADWRAAVAARQGCAAPVAPGAA